MAQPIDRLVAAFDALPASIALIDQEGNIRSVNATWVQYGEGAGGVRELCGVGVNYLDVCNAAHGDSREDGRHVAAGIQAVLSGRLNEFSHDYQAVCAGNQGWHRVTVRPIHGGAMIMHVDVTGLVQARELASEAVGNDPLTDLLNRHMFLMDFETLIREAQCKDEILGLYFIKLEGLRSINARIGYHAGDVLLRETASRLRAKARTTDLLGRIGGDELAVARGGIVESGDVSAFGEYLTKALKRPLLVKNELIYPFLSVGVVSMPEHGKDSGTLMDFADQATMLAHSRGGGIQYLSL